MKEIKKEKRERGGVIEEKKMLSLVRQMKIKFLGVQIMVIL